MLLAEAVTFDPGLVVAVFVVFLLVCAAALAVVVTGLCAGFRVGRDPGRTKAMTAWRTCLGFEAAALLLAVVAGAPLTFCAIVAALTALTAAMPRLGAVTRRA